MTTLHASTDNEKTASYVRARMRSIEDYYLKTLHTLLADSDLVYTLSFRRQPAAFMLEPCCKGKTTLDLVINDALGRAGGLYLSSGNEAPHDNTPPADVLIVEPQSASRAWENLRRIVLTAEHQNKIVSVLNIGGTFGRLYRREGKQFTPIFDREFKSFETYQTDDELSTRLHRDLLNF